MYSYYDTNIMNMMLRAVDHKSHRKSPIRKRSLRPSRAVEAINIKPAISMDVRALGDI